jgi:uncharacterized damage-inducible protein DinB
MIEQAPSLTEFYSGWKTYQQNLVEIIEPLTAEQLAIPASSHHWTVGQVAQHIIGNRVWWFQVWMGEGNPELAPIAHWDPQDSEAVSPRTAAQLVAGLHSTWQMIADALAHWTHADLTHIFSPPAVMSEEEQKLFGDLTRQWIIWHVLEHEIHHGGELSLALGQNGLPGIYGPA